MARARSRKSPPRSRGKRRRAAAPARSKRAASFPPADILSRLRPVPGRGGEQFVDPQTGEIFSRYAVRTSRTEGHLTPELKSALRRLGLPPERYVIDSMGRRRDQVADLQRVTDRYIRKLGTEGIKISKRDLWRRHQKPTARVEILQAEFYDAVERLRGSRDAAGRLLLNPAPDGPMADVLETLGYRPRPFDFPVGSFYDDVALAQLNLWREELGYPARAS